MSIDVLLVSIVPCLAKNVEMSYSLLFDDFVALNTTLRGLWNKFASGALDREMSAEVVSCLEKIDRALREASVDDLEGMCFSESTSTFFPVVAAMSISPVPTLDAQLKSLKVFKTAVAAISNSSPSAAALLAKLFRSHNVLDGFGLAMKSAVDGHEDIVFGSLVEALFVCSATNRSLAQQLLCSEIVGDLSRYVRVAPTSESMYFLLSLLRVVALDGSRDHSSMILASHHVHEELFQLVKRNVSGNEAEATATIHGLAFQLLSILLQNCPSAFGEVLSDATLPSFLHSVILSPWSEVLCGVSQFIRSVFLMMPRSDLSSGLLASEVAEGLLMLVNCSTPHVAANAAAAVRSLVLHGGSNAGRKVVCGRIGMHSLLTVLLDDSLGRPDATADLRILRSETALCLGIFVASSRVNRDLLAQRLRQFFSPHSLQLLREAVLDGINDYHSSIFASWPIEDIASRDVVLQWIDDGIAPRTTGEVFHRQEMVKEATLNEKISLSKHEKAVLSTIVGSVVDFGLFVQQLLCHAVEIAFAGAAAPDNSRKPRTVDLTGGNAAETSDKALKLLLQFARFYGKPLLSKPSSGRGGKISKERNVWEPKKAHEPSHRTWTISIVERKDLFSFRCDIACLKDDLHRVQNEITQRIRRVHAELQTCPNSKIERRTFLEDLYENVLPKVALCFKFLSALCGQEQGVQAIAAVLSERGDTFVDAGNLHDLYISFCS